MTVVILTRHCFVYQSVYTEKNPGKFFFFFNQYHIRKVDQSLTSITNSGREVGVDMKPKLLENFNHRIQSTVIL